MKECKVFYKTFETNIGVLGIVWRLENKKPIIMEILLPQFLMTGIKKNYPFILQGSNKIIDKIIKDINLYLNGKSVRFTLDRLDLSRLGRFQLKVLLETRKIPRGSVRTYGEIAKRLKNPRGARAVGQALAKNPFPIIIPCHRVIGAHRTPGGFGGGIELKRRLLSIDGVEL